MKTLKQMREEILDCKNSLKIKEKELLSLEKVYNNCKYKDGDVVIIPELKCAGLVSSIHDVKIGKTIYKVYVHTGNMEFVSEKNLIPYDEVSKNLYLSKEI